MSADDYYHLHILDYYNIIYAMHQSNKINYVALSLYYISL